jgi:hypothetical protein
MRRPTSLAERPDVPPSRFRVPRRLRRLTALVLASIATISLLPAAASAQGAPVFVELRGDSLFAPRDFTAGTITVRFEARGSRDAALHFYRIPAGAEFDEFRAQVMASSPGRMDALAAGGPVPGRDSIGSVATMDVRQGRYLIVATPPGSAAFPRQKSRYTMSTAVMKYAVLQAPAFIVDATVTLSDREVRVSNAVRAGRRRLRIRNAGPDQHGLQIVRLAQGRTRADALQWLRERKGARPFEWAGGTAPMSKERDAWVDLEFGKGSYLVLCPVRGKDGRLHADGGAWTTLSVH